MELSIVIVSFNTRDILRNCIKSIYQETKNIKYEVIVSDNNSTDGSAEMIEKEFHEVILIKNNSNIGFSSANNLGFKITKGRYVLALNPDTIILNNALEKMVRFMDLYPEAGVCGCKLLNEDRTLQPSWENFPNIFSEIFYSTPLNKIFPHDKRIKKGSFYEVDWVTGACLMVNRKTLEETKGFDEDYNPIYSEETDWCFRIKKLGWKIYYYPEPEVIHLVGQSTKKRFIWSLLQLHRNKYTFFRKNYGVLYANTYRLFRIITYINFVVFLFVICLFDPDKKQLLNQKIKLLKLFLHPGLKISNIDEKIKIDPYQQQKVFTKKVVENKLSIIIVNWNKKELLNNCLESIYNNIKKINFNVLVVDNASSDGSSKMVKEHFPFVELIENSENLGFAKGNNQAIVRTNSEYILLLNNDTVILPDSIDKMIAFMDNNPRIGLLGPQLLNEKNKVQNSYWIKFPSLWVVLLKYLYFYQVLQFVRNKLNKNIKTPLQVGHVLGACLLIRKEIIEDVGILDEQFYMFLEETDWCYRIKEKGWLIYYLPEAKVIHIGQQSSEINLLVTAREYPKSYLKYFNKHDSGFKYKINFLKFIIFIGIIVRIILFSLKYIVTMNDSRKKHIEIDWKVLKEVLAY